MRWGWGKWLIWLRRAAVGLDPILDDFKATLADVTAGNQLGLVGWGIGCFWGGFTDNEWKRLTPFPFFLADPSQSCFDHVDA